MDPDALLDHCCRRVFEGVRVATQTPSITRSETRFGPSKRVLWLLQADVGCSIFA